MGTRINCKARIEARREEAVRKLRARAASIEAEERIRLERCSWDAAEMERQLHTGSRSRYYPRTAYMTAVVEKKTRKVVYTAVSSEFFRGYSGSFHRFTPLFNGISTHKYTLIMPLRLQKWGKNRVKHQNGIVNRKWIKQAKIALK